MAKKAFSGVAGSARFDRPDQQRHIDSISKNIAILTGQTRSKLDRAVLMRDLQDLGLVDKSGKLSSNIGGGSNTTIYQGGGGGVVDPAPETPTKPLNVVATPGFTTIMVQWDTPSYAGHGYAEIWRNTVNSLGDMLDPRDPGEAAKVATVTGSLYVDAVNYDTGYYYWVRFVNTDGVTGPVHNASGVYAKTLRSISDMLDEFEQSNTQALQTFQDNFNQALSDANDLVAATDAKAEEALGKFELIDQLNSDVLTLADGLFNSIVINDEDSTAKLQRLLDTRNQLITDITAEKNTRIAELESVRNNLLAEETARRDALEQQHSELISYYDTQSAKIWAEAQRLSDAIIAEASARAGALQAIVDEYDANFAAIESTYYKKEDTDNLVAGAIETFKSGFLADNYVTVSVLSTDYYTSASTDNAIAQAISTFQSGYLNDNYTTTALLQQDYVTKTDSSSAISQAVSELKTDYVDVNFVTNAALTQNYYTKSGADSAISQAINTFSSTYIDPNFVTNSTLSSNYYTKSTTDISIARAVESITSQLADASFAAIANIDQTFYSSSARDAAIAGAIQKFNTEFIEPTYATTAFLQQEYYTKAGVDGAISQAVFQLETGFTDVNQLVLSVIDESYYTSSETDGAISQAITDFKTSYLDPNFVTSSSLSVNYYSKSQADSAISQAIETHKTSYLDENFVSVSTLTTDYYTQSDVDAAINEAKLETEAKVAEGLFLSVANNSTTFYSSAARDAAIAGKIEEFKTDYVDQNFVTGATLSQDYYSKSATDGAIAQAITEFKSLTADAIYASQATLTTDYYTITEAEQAISNAIAQYNSTTISPTYVTNSALETSYYTKTNTDSAIASAINALKSDYIDVNFATTATLTQNHYTKTQANSAISAAINTFQSGVLEADYTSTADLQSAYYTKTQADSAISEAITLFNTNTLTANYTNSADLAQNYYTKTGADSAISSALTTFKSQTLDSEYASKSTLTNDYYTKTAANSAISGAVSTLKGEFVDNNGDITQAFSDKINSVVVTDEGAVASVIDNYTVSYGGNDYTLAAMAQVSVDVSGAYSAQWGIQSNVGNLQHGIGFMNVNGKTTFMMAADSVVAYNPVNGQFKPIFGVEGGQVFLTEAVIGDAFVQSLTVELVSVFEGDVLVNTKLTAAKIKGAKIETDELWLRNGSYSITLDPVDNLAMWFGSTTYYNPDTGTDTRAVSNAKFALRNNGEIIARGIKIYNNSNQLILSANGVNGTYIQDLTVGTLKIANDAVTKPTPLETAFIESSALGANDEVFDTTINASAQGTVMSSIGVSLNTNDYSPGGSVITVDLVYELYQGTTTSTLIDSMAISVRVEGYASGAVVPLFVAGVSTNNQYRLILKASNGNSSPFKVKAKGHVISAKK